jgi:type I restriction enzyme R subunit
VYYPKNKTMTSNFDFINNRRFTAVYEAAKDAEQQVYTKSVTSGMLSRQAMELLINWVYDIDVEYQLPFPNSLANKIHGDLKSDREVSDDLIYELDVIRKYGNDAVHKRKMSSRDAYVSVKFLFHFCQYVVRTYTDLAYPESFEDNLVPKESPIAVQQRQIETLLKELEAQTQKIEQERQAAEAKAKENEQLRAELDGQRREAAEQKKAPKITAMPKPPFTEAETRKIFIDAALKAAGWDVSPKNVKEFEVSNMPKDINKTGKGYIDYVLWGDDGLPLAVIEAKRTTKKEDKGKTQAQVYANCLEQIYNRRPLIFYTNGFNITLWDDTIYPPRPVHGYYTKNQLQRLIDRRTTRKDITAVTPDPSIAGRYYQKGAIQRVAETFYVPTLDEKQPKDNGRRRRALLVMATGTGKTRTSIALVDNLFKANWVKRVLFLADRKELVKQAKNSFFDHLSHLAAINLSKEANNTTARLVFSTYQTMINRIDNDQFSVGHFDLIIVDEAHRSIYKKYESIFHYFDGFIVGLTATPRDETHLDTYAFFDCQNNVPTYYYELDQAVKDEFLVPPMELQIETKFLKRGIKYNDLNDKEKEQYEAAFAAWGEDLQDEIDASVINKWLFNKDTVVKVLDALMRNGHKIDSGEKLGKTIIFAKDQKHADYVLKVFDQQYPQLAGNFAKVISYKEGKFAESLITDFKVPERFPQIAVSVDMLETGIDVPEILNLVFFKPIYSKTKFWQMLGRGTRLCEGLDVAGQEGIDKPSFLVFDCFDNFGYFNEQPKGRKANPVISLSNRIFKFRIELGELLRADIYQNEDDLQVYRHQLLDESHALVAELFKGREEQFRVKMYLEIIEKYSHRNNWNVINTGDFIALTENVGTLVQIEDPDHKAKQFDALIYAMQLAHLKQESTFEQGKSNIQRRAKRLASMANIPAVKAKMKMIKAVQDDAYWEGITVQELQKIQADLRDLMKLIEPDKKNPYETDIEDIMTVADAKAVYLPSAPADYVTKVKSFIREHRSHIVIKKIHNNQPITAAELQQLEHLVFDGKERGTKEKFQQTTGSDTPMVLFIRSIIGLNRSAALAAFSEFLEKGNLSAKQQKFIEHIINFFESNGTLDPALLYEPPFTHIHSEGLDGVFDDDSSDRIVSIVRGMGVFGVSG